jgi:hypothetical protein
MPEIRVVPQFQAGNYCATTKLVYSNTTTTATQHNNTTTLQQQQHTRRV